ncbi:MAG: heavy metal translocating P-type ATPase [Promethearchaeota archaeon]
MSLDVSTTVEQSEVPNTSSIDVDECAACTPRKSRGSQDDHGHGHDHEEGEGGFHERHVRLFLLVASTFLALAIAWEAVGGTVWVGQILAAAAVALAGVEIFENAYWELRNRSININFLMSIAAVGSFFIAKGQEGATAMVLFSLAELVEEYASDRSKREVGKLLSLAPDEVEVKHDHGACELDGDGIEPHDEALPTLVKPRSKVRVGEVFVVRPGARIPLDGRVVCGESWVNQAAVTGESVPVFKGVDAGDDLVYAGTVNGDGYLEVQATVPPGDTLLDRITREMEKARKNKSNAEKFVEKFARYYTPAIALLAALVVVIPPLFLGRPFATWFYRGLVLLVVSCPCALTLSTPVTMVSALTRLTSRGILVKGSKYVEELGRVKAFAFDKTGTLTEGRVALHDVVAFGDLTEEQLLELAATVESRSEHPLARAVVEAALARGLRVDGQRLTKFEVVKGKGVVASLDGQQLVVGSVEFANGFGLSVPKEPVDQLRSQGKTVVAVGVLANGRGGGGETLGLLTLRDALRKSASILTWALSDRGIRTVILSGDHRDTVKGIAECLNVTDFRGELLPDQKIEAIKSLREQAGSVAMVGDGVNDAPAMAVASVGIAMGRSGSDVTVENADVTISNDDLTKVIVLLNVALKTRGTLRTNIWGSILVKLTLAVLTVFGLVSLWVAVGVGDMGVSLAVVFNGLSILRFRDFSFEIEASLKGDLERVSVCVNCGEPFPAPEHCGLQMVPEGSRLVCWRNVSAKVARNGNGGHTCLVVDEPLCATCSSGAAVEKKEL